MKKSFRILALMMVLMIGIGSFLAFPQQRPNPGIRCTEEHQECRRFVLQMPGSFWETWMALNACDAAYLGCIVATAML